MVTQNVLHAYHEAGHAVMMWHQGIRFTKVTITPETTYVTTNPPDDTDIATARQDNAARLRLEAFILISLAGPVTAFIARCNLAEEEKEKTLAEGILNLARLWTHIMGEAYKAEGCTEPDDFTLSKVLLEGIVYSPKEYAAAGYWLYERTRSILTQLWLAVELVTNRLIVKRTLSYEEVCEICERSKATIDKSRAHHADA